MSFVAGFESDCEDCEARVLPGQQARMISYRKGRVAHVVCPTPAPVCPTCNLEHRGECF